MSMSERSKAVDAERLTISKELKRDKTRLHEDVERLQEKLDIATNKILTLSVANAQLKKEVSFFRDTKLSRDIGAAVLAVCGLTAPLFSYRWWYEMHFDTIYYGIAVCAATSVILGTLFSRRETD